MPHLTVAVDPIKGPMLRLLTGVSTPRARALQAAGHPVPALVEVEFLLDTGAACTVMDEAVIKALNLTPTGQTQVCTPTTGKGTVSCLQYDVSLMLYHAENSRIFSSLPVIATDLARQNLGGLIGRDVLANCLFVYDGAAKTFSLAF